MYETCRHIKTDGIKCDSPAIKKTLFCFNHTRIKKLTRARRRNPCDFTYTPPFLFPEDRSSLQINFFLVLQALAGGKIDNQTANSMTRNLRACALNLGKTPLVEPDKNNAVHSVILTPDGDEIGLPLEVLEPGEEPPIHHKNCPCRICAEQYRGVAPERHHTDCVCGLCAEDPKDDRSAEAAGENSTRPNEPEAQESAFTAPSFALNAAADDKPPGIVADAEEEPVDGPDCLNGMLSLMARSASARVLRQQKSGPKTATKRPGADDFYDILYPEEMKKHKAEYRARAQAAIETGLQPPPCEPFDPSKVVSEATKRYQAEMEQIEKNKQAAREMWKRRFPDEPLDNICTLTWNEQEDLRVAQMKAVGEWPTQASFA